jgi:N-acetylmuramoyl-L-alanine amidase
MSKLVLVSAGHSNAAPGAISGALREADFTLLIRNRIHHFLQLKNFPHITDGHDGVNFSLVDAIKAAKGANGTKVEIHLNSGPPTAKGIEALSLKTHKIAAQELAMTADRILGFGLRGEKGWKDQSSGAHSRLGFCLVGGIILEVCFITNAREMEVLTAKIDDLAEALADTLIKLNK